MNKIQRVTAALRGDAVDRVPASFWFHFAAAQRAGQAMADAHLAYYRSADPDFLKVMNDNDYVPAGQSRVHAVSDWRYLEPAPLSAPHFQAQLHGLRLLVEQLGEETLLITTLFNVFSVGNKLSGGKLIDHVRADPAAVNAGLATVAASQAEFARACIEAGAAGLYFSAQGGSQDHFAAAEWAQVIQPHDLTILQAAAAAGATFNLLHICGERLRLEGYANYPAHAVNWAPQLGNLSLPEGRKLFQATIVGGVDQRGPIVDGSRVEVEAEVHAALAAMGRHGCMLGAGCTLPNDIAVEHLVWARAAVLSAP